MRYLNQDAENYQIADCQRRGRETGEITEFCTTCRRHQENFCPL